MKVPTSADRQRAGNEVTMNRREVLSILPASAAAMALPRVFGQGPERKPGSHEVVPLPFDPKALRGLSERLLSSHHGNNYAGAVHNLNRVEAELAAATKDTQAFVVAGLRERELTFRNSATLHELYFGNLGGDGKFAGGIADAIGGAFGGMARFEELFRATAMALAGGSGWVVLGYDLHRPGLAIAGSGGHTHQPAAWLPVLVLDMFEHAYHLDYGAAAAKYVDAFFANLRVEELDRRLAAAVKASSAMRN
jgi:Fe-Mn family superoxide dismutase